MAITLNETAMEAARDAYNDRNATTFRVLSEAIRAYLAALPAPAESALAEMAKKLEQAEGARDHYLSNWKEAAEYLRIETFHAETAEAALAEMRVELERLRLALEPNRREFNRWFVRHYPDADGKFTHLPRWFKGDLWETWQAARALGRLKDGEAGK